NGSQWFRARFGLKIRVSAVRLRPRPPTCSLGGYTPSPLPGGPLNLVPAGARTYALLAAICGIVGSAVDRAGAAWQTDAQKSIRFVRSSSGTRGKNDGTRYIIEDPSSVFSAAEDRQIVVLFEWEGQPGTHHCELR